jgi:hypothetical protein
MAPLLRLPGLLADHGVDADVAIREVGCDPALFTDPENTIDFAAVGRLLVHTASVMGNPYPGLELGRRWGLEVLGAVAGAPRFAPHLATALRALILHFMDGTSDARRLNHKVRRLLHRIFVSGSGLDGVYLQGTAPQPAFGGVIKEQAVRSKPWWAPRIVPPQDAPNILLIITDDAGFGVASTFGGVIPAPTLDRVANEGLRCNNIHSTALCSPSRAALITGRNHHCVGFGVIAEHSTGFPGYNSILPEDKATIGRILRDNGYGTSRFGEDHNRPAFAASQAGPFDKWHTGQGFEYFYGFVGGDASQWEPNLFRNTTQIHPFKGKPAGT